MYVINYIEGNIMTFGIDTSMMMHQQAVDMHNQVVMQNNALAQQQNQMTNMQNLQSFTQPQGDCFVKNNGILPPKNWKPDKFAGLGPELSPQEKLKKKYEDLKKPMYMNQTQQEAEVQEEKPKTFKQKIKDFGAKIKNYFKNLFHKNKEES